MLKILYVNLWRVCRSLCLSGFASLVGLIFLNISELALLGIEARLFQTLLLLGGLVLLCGYNSPPFVHKQIRDS